MLEEHRMKTANLAIRFLLELSALAALAVWGFRTGDSLALKILLGIGVPLLAAAAWGTFRVDGDPNKAPVRVPGPLRLLLELAVFGGATAGLYAAGFPTLALIFALVVIINYAFLYERLVWIIRQ
jgi:hypothetical protein